MWRTRLYGWALVHVLVLTPSAQEADLRRMPADGALVVDPVGDDALIAAQLNGRPRQTLAWRTPAEKMTELLR